MSAAFLGTLHHVEVLLRNAIDRQFPGSERDQLLSVCRPDVWLTDPGVLEDLGREKVNEAIGRLVGEKRRPTRPRVIASLTLGFWCALFAGRYEELWRSVLVNAFPDGNGRRNQVRKALTRILQLRNQIAHHEAIFGRNLGKDYETVLELSSWIDPEAHRYFRRISQIEGLLELQPSTIAG